ncbi:MAG: hypothetical protein OXI49_17520 [Acidobacteriota bacterium]|nr:hypothetical protein [Acidobacteriota bacterium]
MDEPVTFAGWEVGPQECFQERWADPLFKRQALSFLSKFVGTDSKPIRNPAILCREGRSLDGEAASPEEVGALQLSLVFAFLDGNPRSRPDNREHGWAMVTADNADLHAWPIDLEQGRVITSTGFLVETRAVAPSGSDRGLVLSPPVDLHMPSFAYSPDPLILTGIYEAVLGSLRFPGASRGSDALRVAVDWFARAWRNTSTVEYAERLVYLKIAFEALTGTSNNWKSARWLREMFEALPDTTREDSEILVWSPEEEPVHPRHWKDRWGHAQSTLITDLEHWFMEFGKARNTIIHEGRVPELMYSGPNSAYAGSFFATAEFLLRAVIKVQLSKLGHDDAWWPRLWRVSDDV